MIYTLRSLCRQNLRHEPGALAVHAGICARGAGQPAFLSRPLYKAFEPEVAYRLMEKLKFVYTPKHGSWLNMAECEISALSRQCLNRRLVGMETVRKEVDTWTATRTDLL